VETAAIRYRVADFLKKQPPFDAISEDDLLALAGTGRVKFFEPNQYILSQGASRVQIYVIQQGIVSLWDERSPEGRLLDLRGAGDILGIDQLQETRGYPYSATSTNDVLVYTFPIEEFETLLEKYPAAAEYVAAYGNLTGSGRVSRAQTDPQNLSVRDLVTGQKLAICGAEATIREVARQLQDGGLDAIVVQDSQQRLRGIVTAGTLVRWLADGGNTADKPVATLLHDSPLKISPEASVGDAVIALSSVDHGALAVTTDDTSSSSTISVVTFAKLGQAFGDRPTEILREVAHATNTRALRELNQRARSFALRYLNNAETVGWLTRFVSAVDSAIVRRIIAIVAPERIEGCWCFCGTSGRREGLTRQRPELILITNDDRGFEIARRVVACIEECGYLPAGDRDTEPEFHVATSEEWRERFLKWMDDPVFQKIYLARPFFDLRPVFGADATWESLETSVRDHINPDFLFVVANDCLSTLPPLTFFRDVVLAETGEELGIFRLEETALRPLVDVGRVFGLATRKIFGTSTLERFALAQESLPASASIFREASEALRIVLWQQGRIGIRQGTTGSDLPPALLGPYDRQLLKSAFRSISRLIEFTGDLEWLKAL